MPVVTHLWISYYVRKINTCLCKLPQSGFLLFATLTNMPNDHDTTTNSYHLLSVCYELCTTLYVLCILSHFILMATLWSRRCYYSHFIDKETEVHFIWLAQGHTACKGFKSSTWLQNLYSSANSILSSETLNTISVKITN